MHRKLIRRLLWMFVFVIAISAAVIYFTFDISLNRGVLLRPLAFWDWDWFLMVCG